MSELVETDVASIKGWVKKTMYTLAGTAVLGAAVWFGSFISDSAQIAADRHITTVMNTALPGFADPVYLKRVEFNQYQQAQVVQANEAELRRLQQDIIRLEGEIQYGNLSPARQAQEEDQLKLLKQQEQDLLRKLEQTQ